MNLPIVFIHTGFQDYLKTTVYQAKSFNPSTEIIFLGDASNQSLQNICHHYLLEEYSKSATDFINVYRHFSSNSVSYELFCFTRWFILLDFMCEKNLDWVFVADTDVMIYTSVKTFFKKHVQLKNHKAAFFYPKQDYDELRWMASGHVSFISRQFLISFCNFMKSSYANNLALLERKINYHKEENVPGGIADMTFFYLYPRCVDANFLNLSSCNKGRIFNVNVGPNKSRQEIELSSIYWKRFSLFQKRRPYILNENRKAIRLETLHMQGGAKFYMQKVYTGIWHKAIWKGKLKRILDKASGNS